MNQRSEQLGQGLNICIDYDQPLKRRGIREAMAKWLGDRCGEVPILGRKVMSYAGPKGKKTILLTKAVTYLGNPHPVFKKRIQIPRDWLEFTRRALSQGYDVRFIGVYHYDGTLAFVDFEKETYLVKSCHNSSAHVYINDLYQGLSHGYFEKRDLNGNLIRVVTPDLFRKYLDKGLGESKLATLFSAFNETFEFDRWIEAKDAIEVMRQANWRNWRQAEWPGFYLEYKMSEFASKAFVKPHIQCTGMARKGRGKGKAKLDFDLRFPREGFYGDLKASDITKKQAPYNDVAAFMQCLADCGRFWYVIYEHETVKDSECGFEATRFRNRLIKEADNVSDDKYDEMSYSGRMKNKVNFRRMAIIELNKVNFGQALAQFNQGHQPDGSARAPKFLINKKDIDNFVVYRYERPAAGFRFIDLFCGIGGFHQAMTSMGGECVFAAEIDRDCIDTYKANYGLDSEHDMTRLSVDDVPAHDVLCAGFPCQAFSKAGKQAGINDTRGTLFFEIERVLRAHHPRYIMLENVRNLVSHDDGRTWATITSVLRDIGYRLNHEPIVLSPHQFGVPQLRERVYIAGVYDPEHAADDLGIAFDGLMDKNELSIYDVLDAGADSPQYRISEQEERVLTAWNEFYQGIDLKVIGFPVVADYFPPFSSLTDTELEAMPKWKQSHIRRNRQLYAANRAFIDGWLRKWNNLEGFTPTQRKLEWQAGENISSIFEGLIQMRPSGIRVKTPTVFPALVAMVQIPIIGRYRRRLTPRECARLQSFPDSFKICPNDHQAYKQFGNSVNVDVLKHVFGKLAGL